MRTLARYRVIVSRHTLAWVADDSEEIGRFHWWVWAYVTATWWLMLHPHGLAEVQVRDVPRIPRAIARKGY